MPKTARGPRQALPDRAAAEALPNRIEAPRFMLPVCEHFDVAKLCSESDQKSWCVMIAGVE
jgi:hypothetical protein